MNLDLPTSPGFQRSQSDRDLTTTERRLNRISLNGSSSSSNIPSQTLRPVLSPNLPWDRLQKWFVGFAIVTFDLELGQSIEYLIPNYCKLTDKERLNISYLAFPDTNSTALGDFQYHFRIEHDSSSLSTFEQEYNSIVPAALQIDRQSLFGYVNFRQKRDANIKRGYFQKSFVILSKYPFISLFLILVEQLAKIFFQSGLSSLESCCQLMDSQWPEPTPGKTLLLPLLDNVLQVRIPTHGDKPFSPSDLVQFRSIFSEPMTNQTFKFPIDDDTEFEPDDGSSTTETTSKSEQILPRLIPFVYDVNTYQSLACVLTHIQLLWELILLNQPIAVVGNFPTKCSQTVQALSNTRC